MASSGPPPRPPPWEERLADALLKVGAPRVRRRAPQPDPPASLAPFERVLAPRRHASGVLDCTWYPAAGEPKGAVLLAPPWTDHGQAYLHRRGRVEALRAAGYAVLTFDMGGFGRSTPTRGFRDRDAADALDELRRRAPGVPHHAWGLSSGGYWLHPLLAREDGVAGAFFEDVTPHLLEWRAHVGLPFSGSHKAFARLLPRADRYMDLRHHAPHLRARAVAYVAGGADPGIPEADARGLARLARAECLVVPGATHLHAMKRTPREVVGLALATFERAEKAA